MRKLETTLFAASLFVGLVTLPDLTFAQSKKAIFNGKDFSGWHNYNTTGVSPIWQVDSGAMVLTGAKGGDIVTDAEYENFELEWEWKISANGNSGVFYLVDERKEYAVPYLTGVEYQILDNKGHKDGKLLSHQAGADYDIYPAKEDATKPVGEWNSSKIRIVKGHVEHHMNGKLLLSYDLWTEKWKSDVAASKFKAMPAYGLAKKGKIGLQDHGDKVWYRNIFITKL
jgi:hypothetical protein